MPLFATPRPSTPHLDARLPSLRAALGAASRADGSRCVTRDPQTSPATEPAPTAQARRPSPFPPLRAVRQDNGSRHVRDFLAEALPGAARRRSAP